MSATDDCNLCNSHGFVIDRKCGHTVTCPYCGGSGQFAVDWTDDGPYIVDRDPEVERYLKNYLPIYDENGDLIEYEDYNADLTMKHIWD